MKMKKRFLGILFSLVMVLGLMPGMSLTAYAKSEVKYLDASGTEQSITNYTVVESDTRSLRQGWYVVNSDVEINETFSISGDANLILCDGAKLTVTSSRDGISATRGSLTIYAQSTSDNMGKLEVTSGSAGIRLLKNLTINGGKIETQGSNGIICQDADITINGGNVTADGGIFFSTQNNLTITGGKVIASATGTDSGIYTEGEVIISGGNVSVTGDENPAISGTVKNSIAGTGWTNKAGTEGKADIAISTGQTLDYIKVQFPAAASHTHNFTYSSDGATITATCSVAGCPLTNNQATLTIVKPTLTTYDQTGEGISAEATITDANSIQGEAKVSYYNATKSGETYTKTGNVLAAAPTDAGDYVAEITLGTEDSNKATASVGYTIAKADPTATAPSPTATYGQTLKDVTLTNPTGNTAGTWAWEDAETTSVGGVGSNTFQATFTPDSSNYKTVENVNVTVTVSKAAHTGAAKIHCSGTRSFMNKSASLDVTLRKAALPSTCSLGEAVDTLWGWGNGNITSATVSGDNNVSIDKSNKTITINDLGTSNISITFAHVNGATMSISATITVTELPTYSVTLNTNGGTISEGKNVTSYVQEMGATLPTSTDITNGDKVFEGWFDNSELTGDAVTSILTTDTGNKEYWAKWKTPHTHSFTYAASGATITATCSAEDCDLKDSKTTLTIVAPTMTLYQETGKSEVASLTGLQDFNTATGKSLAVTNIMYVGRDGTEYTESTTAPNNAGKYTATITMSGVKTAEGDDKSVAANVDYSIKYAVTFNTNGGSAVPQQLVEAGESATRPTDPTREGNIFGGWFADADFAKSYVFDEVTENTTVYAKWGEHRVTWTVGEFSIQDVFTGDAPAADSNTTMNLAAETLKPDGATLSWKTETDVSGDVTHTAQFSFPVTLNVNGGTINAGNVESYIYGTGATLPTDVTRAKYDFGGWYANSELTGTAVTQIGTTATGSKEFWAKWTAVYAVTATVTANNRTYDGTEKPLVTVTGTATGGEMQYALGTKDTATQPYTTSIPTATDARTYYVWYKVVGDANHNDTKAASVKVSIAKRSVTLTSATGTKVYDASALTDATVTVTGDGFATGEGAAYDVTGSQTLAGESKNTFTYTLNNGTKADNYEITKIEGTLTVEKAESSGKVTAISGLVYDGAEKALVNSEVHGGIFMYRLGTDGEWTEDIPEAVAFDTYTVYYYIEGDGNHKDNGSTTEPMGTVDVTIKCPYSNEWVDGKWYNKDGSQTYKPLGSWKKDGSNWKYVDTSGWYPKNQWQKIDGKWYFFDKEGYMEANAYRQGYYLKANGAWDGKAKVAGWKQDSKGWWYSLGGSDFLKNGWKKIDGNWYYFKATGYIAINEFVQGWWLNKAGAWKDPVRYSWHKSGSKWWYGTKDGWYAKSKSYTIDGKKYTFDKKGYTK